MSKIIVADYIFKDMKKYYRPFDQSDYSVSYDDQTDPSLLSTLRDYYNSHLPIPLAPWRRVNAPDENLIYKSGFGKQIDFIENVIVPLCFNSYKDAEENPVMVISTHSSKSVLLPVYQIRTCYATFTLRFNFFDWKVSVDSEVPFYCDMIGLFDEEEAIPVVFCEGFPVRLVFNSFSTNKSQFTCEISNDYKLYTFFYILRNYLKSLKLRYDFSKEIRDYISKL